VSGFYAASQSGVLIEGEFIDVVDPGNIVILDGDCVSEIAVLARPNRSHCINEELFKQRPGNLSGRKDISQIRLDIGKELGKKAVEALGRRRKYQAIPILEGGRLFSMGFLESVSANFFVDPAGSYRSNYSVNPVMLRQAEALGLSKNFSSGSIPNIQNKRVVLIDDQLRSGSKIRHMASDCRRKGAKDVVAVVGSIGHQKCPFGDAAYEELGIVAGKNKEQVCRELGISDLITLNIKELVDAIGTPDRIYCAKCLLQSPPV
jgi:amidophosphoribosyltransferase